jgi:hypothetical protein
MGSIEPGVGVRAPRAHRSRAAALSDLAFLAALGSFWAIYVTPIVTVERLRGGDIFRDVASAVNIQHGQVFSDPAYVGQTIWYPPLSPALMAGVSAVFDITPADAYRWSQLLFNWLIPAGMYGIVSRQWNRRAAWVAVVALLLAMPWWQSEVVQGQPSVHAVVWGWVAMWLYAQQRHRRSWGWTVAGGVFQGIAFWHHPLIPAVLTLTCVLHSCWEWSAARVPPDERAVVNAALRRDLAMVGLTLACAAPILYLMLHGPVYNRAPRTFLAPELRTAAFALLHGNPWIWIMGLVGVVVSVRRDEWASRWLLLVLAVCLLGQLPAYLRLAGCPGATHVPVIVPHEFQWTFQLAWAVCVGVGADHGLRYLTARWKLGRWQAPATAGLTALAVALTGVWQMPQVHRNLRRFVHRYATNFPEATAWIREHTHINDVFACESQRAFAWLGPDTGRKVWISEAGHSNPRVDWETRRQVLSELAEAPTPEAFARLAQRCGIKYCIPSTGWMPRILADSALREVAVPRYLRSAYQDRKLAILEVVSGPDDLNQLEPLGTPPINDGVQ